MPYGDIGVNHMNKARLAEAGRGIIPNGKISTFGSEIVVDFCVSAEHRTGNCIQPQLMHDAWERPWAWTEQKNVCLLQSVTFHRRK